MYRIAVLLTCFNRKPKTVSSLEHLYAAQREVSGKVDLSVYLTDDGCTDDTVAAVIARFPEVKILAGTGSLYWAGGMRNSWSQARENDHDAYLLLNDDTNVYPTLFTELLETDEFCNSKFNKRGIYIGSTIDDETNQHTYGGHVLDNRILARSVKVVPNGSTPQPCELGNANIMWVSADVVRRIGILNKHYVHGLADYDYTLMARRHALPVLITPNYLGTCSDDHTSPYKTFADLSFKDRIKVLSSPLGLDFKSNLHFNRRNFPLRLPLVYLTGCLKVLFPRAYLKRHPTL